MTTDLPQTDANQSSGQNPAPKTGLNQAVSVSQPANKEQKEAFPYGQAEKVPIVEVKDPEPDKEVEDWMEKLEKGEDVQLSQPITDDYGQILVQAAAPQKPKIILPLDDKGIITGLNQKISYSIRWLAEWCLRIIKMEPNRAEYKK